MQEQNRTKLLAALLLGTLAFAAFRPDKILLEPLEELDVQYASAARKLEAAEREEAALLQAQFKLNQWRGQSLPPNALNAQRVYRQWLTTLAEQSGLSSLEVEPGSRTRKSTRDGDVFEAVQVKIRAEGTLAELTRFLYRFKRTDLLQRVRELTMTSEDIEGDPILQILLFAEGLCMQSADDRLDLFSQSSLAGEVPEESTTLRVAEPDRFPAQAGFQIQVGKEYMVVTNLGADGTWTVTRGFDDTSRTTHPANARVEYIPVAENMAGVTFEDYKDLIEKSPFVKPVPPHEYQPRINPIASQNVIRGEALKLRVAVTDMDPTKGGPVFALPSGPEGMQIDGKSGELTWPTTEEVEIAEYPAEVVVTQSGNPELELRQSFVVAVSERNNTPVLTLPAGEIAAWLGQPVRVPIQVQDETPPQDLKFSVSGVEGAYVDTETMTFNWLPTDDLGPGEYVATISVEDAGSPPKRAEGQIRMVARDDAAKFTKIVGAAGLDEQRVAWLFDQINNKTTKVTIGTEISVADIQGTITEIGRKSVTLKTAAGELTISLGKDLRSVMNDLADAQQASVNANANASGNEKTNAVATPPTETTEEPAGN